MRDVLCEEECSDEVVSRAGLPAVGPQSECVHPTNTGWNRSKGKRRGGRETHKTDFLQPTACKLVLYSLCVCLNYFPIQDVLQNLYHTHNRCLCVSPSQPVEHCDIGIHVEDVVGVRWVFGGRPLLRGGHCIGEVGRLRFALIINTIKCYHLVVVGEIVVYSVSEGVLLCLVSHLLPHMRRESIIGEQSEPT